MVKTYIEKCICWVFAVEHSDFGSERSDLTNEGYRKNL